MRNLSLSHNHRLSKSQDIKMFGNSWRKPFSNGGLQQLGAGRRNVHFRGRGGVWVVVMLKIDQMLMYKVAVEGNSSSLRI